MEDTFMRAARAIGKMTCLMPGCCVCTNHVKDEIDAAVAEALAEERAKPQEGVKS
jgi:hypothetical protein